MTTNFRPEDLSFLDRASTVYVFEAPVAAPREQVFAAISADPSTWSWFPGLDRGSYASTPPQGVGSVREVSMRGTTYRETIIGWDPPGLWAYRVDESSVPLAHALVEEWAILDDPAGSTTSIVRWTFALDPKPLFLAGKVAASTVMGGVFRKAMSNLSDQLQSGAASSSGASGNEEKMALGETESTWVPVTLDRCDHVEGPFYHGTRSTLEIGEELVPGHGSNFHDGRASNNIYFSALLETAVWGAELATSLAESGDRGHIYVVEPTGPFEDDPNVTNKKFPGNITQSYRTRQPLRVVGEVNSWEGHAPDVLQAMLDNIARLREQGLDVIED